MPVVYQVKCECGADLEILGCNLDSTDDLVVRVAKCPDCEDEREELKGKVKDLEFERDQLADVIRDSDIPY